MIWLDCPSTGDQLEEQDDDGHNEQQVDETAADAEGKAEQPENEQYDKKRPKHDEYSRILWGAPRCGRCCGSVTLRGCGGSAAAIRVWCPAQESSDRQAASPHGARAPRCRG